MFRSNIALEDFLLFSERVYGRMFELHNAALWPLHVVAISIGVFLLLAAANPRPVLVRVAFGLLSLVWLFVAVAFLYWRYATINWAVIYLVPLFLVMAAVLAVFALRRATPQITPSFHFSYVAAMLVLSFSVVGYPLLGLVVDRPLTMAEVFGITPDPTAVATLAFLAVVRDTRLVLAAIIPIVWIVASALTLYVLGRVDFFVPLVAAVVCIAAFLGRWRQGSSRSTA